MAERGGEQRIPRPLSHRPGGPAPWADTHPAHRRLTLADVRARLERLPTAVAPKAISPGSREAAVLVPLFEEDGEVRVILTKRPDTMPSHQGEIAFPGGTHDAALDADLRATALREAHEEIGLDPSSVEVVAQLPGMATVASKFVITPYVGFLDGRPHLLPDSREVVRVLDVPLSELMDEEVWRAERWDTWMADLEIHFFELEDETVWGATARILTGFLAHLTTAS